MTVVAGVDGRRGGWVAVVLEDGQFADSLFDTAFAELLRRSPIRQPLARHPHRAPPRRERTHRRRCRSRVRRSQAEQRLSSSATCGVGRVDLCRGSRTPPLAVRAVIRPPKEDPRGRGLPRGAGVRGASLGVVCRAGRPTSPTLEAQLERPHGQATATQRSRNRAAGRAEGGAGRSRRRSRRSDRRLVGRAEGAWRGNDASA
jgi:hypothetical protein